MDGLCFEDNLTEFGVSKDGFIQGIEQGSHMATAEELDVEVREETGKRKVKQLRKTGKIPAVIYGHGEESVSLSVPSDEFGRIINKGDRIVCLKGGVASDAFIREVQWDVFGSQVLHIDFTRVAAGEMLDTTVILEVRGVAPGTTMGGVLEQPLQQMAIRIPPRSMTDRIRVVINELALNEKITVAQLNLPEGAEVDLDPDVVVVQCMEKQVVIDPEEETAAAGPAEPEVIGEKKEDGGGDS